MPKQYTITPLSKLSLRSDFMFGQVMRSEEICQLFLEALLGIEIQKIVFIDRGLGLAHSEMGCGFIQYSKPGCKS